MGKMYLVMILNLFEKKEKKEKKNSGRLSDMKPGTALVPV